jgi:purine nucleosidase
MSDRLVLIDHDGGIDDFLATILLMTMPEVQTIGVVVTPADCYIQAALGVTRKILDLMKCYSIPVAQSTVRGLNPFPPIYRQDSIIVNQFPILNEQEVIRTPSISEPGEVFMVKLLQNSPLPVTLMVTGPLTTVAAALNIDPAIASKIEQIVWMGGALEVLGNVEKTYAPEHDGSAEWNAYWDSISVERVWQSDIPFIMCPLDLTNTVPVTVEFVRQLAKLRRYPLCDLAGLCYSLAIPQNYYFWDTLATGYLARPQLYEIREREVDIVTTGISQGRTLISPGGKKIQVMSAVNKEEFLNYFLQQFVGFELGSSLIDPKVN